LVAGLLLDAFDFTREWLDLFSPIMVVIRAESSSFDVHLGNQWLVVAALFLWYGGWLYAFRRSCLLRADRNLGRIVPPHVVPVPAPSEAAVPAD